MCDHYLLPMCACMQWVHCVCVWHSYIIYTLNNDVATDDALLSGVGIASTHLVKSSLMVKM